MCKNQRLEALATSTSRKIALPEAFGVEFGLRILFAGLVHGRIGQTEHDAADHTQDQRRTRGPYPAEVFLHTHIQTMVQPALNDPVLAFELEQTQGLQLGQTQTADQIDYFARPVAVTFDARLQSGH